MKSQNTKSKRLQVVIKSTGKTDESKTMSLCFLLKSRKQELQMSPRFLIRAAIASPLVSVTVCPLLIVALLVPVVATVCIARIA